MIIDVWARWCGPCRAGKAWLERLAWGGRAAGFTIIGSTTDEHRHAAIGWLHRSNPTINQFIDHDLVLVNLLGVAQLPLTVLVDADGRVADKVVGARARDRDAAARLIERASKGDGR